MQVIFYFLWDHWFHPGYFENQIPLNPAPGGVCSLANKSVAYKETQSNQVSDFRDFLCSCFQRQSFLTFILHDRNLTLDSETAQNDKYAFRPRRVLYAGLSEIERKAMIRNRYNYPNPHPPPHQRHQRERNTNTKYLDPNGNITSRSQTDSYFPTKCPNGYPKQKDVSDTHIQRLTITKINHDRRAAVERSVKSISQEGLNRFYVATIVALTSAAV